MLTFSASTTRSIAIQETAEGFGIVIAVDCDHQIDISRESRITTGRHGESAHEIRAQQPSTEPERRCREESRLPPTTGSIERAIENPLTHHLMDLVV